jgi:hypothetical protein
VWPDLVDRQPSNQFLSDRVTVGGDGRGELGRPASRGRDRAADRADLERRSRGGDGADCWWLGRLGCLGGGSLAARAARVSGRIGASGVDPWRRIPGSTGDGWRFPGQSKTRPRPARRQRARLGEAAWRVNRGRSEVDLGANRSRSRKQRLEEEDGVTGELDQERQQPRPDREPATEAGASWRRRSQEDRWMRES